MVRSDLEWAMGMPPESVRVVSPKSTGVIALLNPRNVMLAALPLLQGIDELEAAY